MNAWWWVAAVVAALAPTLAWWTARPWAACRRCGGHGTLRDTWTGKFTGHCPACRGHGQVERAGRVLVRELTGGRIFPHPPEAPAPVMFGGNVPFSGGGRRPRRARRR